MTIKTWMTTELPSERAVYFCTKFSLPKYKRVVLETTALGWFHVYLNGERISLGEFLPNWEDYTKKVALLKYDLTPFLKEENVLGAIVGKGWALGSICFGLCAEYYNIKTPYFYARIQVEDWSGNISYLDELDWQYGYGTILENDILDGETQDYTQPQISFCLEDFEGWQLFPIQKVECELLCEEFSMPFASVHEVFNGKLLTDQKEKVYDFEQNFAGVVRLRVNVKDKALITVRHAEILTENGEIYVENLRKARAIDRYILPKGEYDLRPLLTYHGFRYAGVTIEGEAEIESCQGLAIYTDSKIVGKFRSSSSLLNKIVENCLWSTKSNFLYLPTDCPQRDERLGWMGDIGIFARSAMYEMNLHALLKAYLRTLKDAIGENGEVPVLVPIPKGFLDNALGASAWSDALLTLMWDCYEFYGDADLIAEFFPYAEKFISWVENNSENYCRKTYCFSDWLSLGADLKEGYGDVDFQLFDLCHYAMDCLLMKKFCAVLQKDGSGYTRKYDFAKQFFFEKVYGNHCFEKGTQTALLLAYKAGFLSGDEIKAPLINDIRKNGMTGGFIGVKYLFSVLTELNEFDVAYQLITSEEYPSWGYSIKNGATTLWERWDSYIQGKGVHESGMNSFNHFAFGSCIEWIYGNVLGIQPKEGFKSIRFAPILDWSGCVSSVQGSYESDDGVIEVKWSIVDDCHATASIVMPQAISLNYCFPNSIVENVVENGNMVSFSLKKQ